MSTHDSSRAARRMTLCLLALASVLLAGCPSVQMKNMVPESVGTVTTHHAKSVRIGSITGNQKEVFGGPEMISAEEFKAVLTETFTRARLFSAVTTAPADLELTSRFLAHGQVPIGFTADQAMVVEYTLTDLTTGKEVWKQSINSRFTARLSDAWGGAKRTRMAQEGCVRKNMEQLVAALDRVSL